MPASPKEKLELADSVSWAAAQGLLRYLNSTDDNADNVLANLLSYEAVCRAIKNSMYQRYSDNKNKLDHRVNTMARKVIGRTLTNPDNVLDSGHDDTIGVATRLASTIAVQLESDNLSYVAKRLLETYYAMLKACTVYWRASMSDPKNGFAQLVTSRNIVDQELVARLGLSEADCVATDYGYVLRNIGVIE